FKSRKSDGQVTTLLNAGLVHNPNLYLTNLAREEDPVTEHHNDTRDIALALGLDAGADTETIVTEINRQKTPDPEKFVPLSAVKDLMQSHATQTDANREADVEMTVQRALDDGKISPGMVDWATDLCRQNPASFADFTNSNPAAFDHLFKSPSVFERPAPQSPTGKMTDEELAVCKQLGISPDELVQA
ncbi:MAG: phage protease, partial [Pseudomonadota bacterium]